MASTLSNSFKRKQTAPKSTQSKRPKLSNRPRDSSPSASSSAASGAESNDDETESARAAMLAALEAHQRAYLNDALPNRGPLASTSALATKSGTKGAGKGAAKKQMAQKSVWDMGMDDFEEEDEDESEEEDEDESGEDGQEGALVGAKRPRPAVIEFEEPRLGMAAGTNKDMRAFMSSKVKNARATFSVADLANAKTKGKAKAVPDPVNAEEEAYVPRSAIYRLSYSPLTLFLLRHLSALDASLSTLIRPLTSSTLPTHSQLPLLLSSLPTAPTKLKKGLAPLPPNAPRTLRRGQSAANLQRAKSRDESAGIVLGAQGAGKAGQREFKTLKEKRRDEGSDKRERGLSGAVGKLTRGGLVISKAEIMEATGGGGGRGKGAKRGGGMGRGGAKRGGKRGGKARK